MNKANYQFKLKEPHSPTDTSIRLQFYKDNKRFTFGTGVKIHPKFWNPEDQRTISDRKVIKANKKDYPQLDTQLQIINNRIDKIIRKCNEWFANVELRNENPSFEDLKLFLNASIKSIEANNGNFENKTILYLDQIITEFIKGIKNGSIQTANGKRYKIGSIQVYETLKKSFAKIQDHYKTNWTIEDINSDLAAKWTSYLYSKKSSKSNVGKQHKHFKRVVNVKIREIENENYLRERKGLEPILSDRSISRIQRGLESFKKLESNATDIYLTNEEIKTLYELKNLMPHHEKTRDIFLCGVYSGLRFSDFHRLGPEHHKNGAIEIINEKTKHKVKIPIRPELRYILNKYDNKLPLISSQKLNVYIKEVCKIAGFTDEKEVTVSKGGLDVITKKSKYKLVTTKTARKSFACNLHLEGNFSIRDIMTLTGHKNLKSFQTYIEPVISDISKRAKDSAFFRGEILKVG